VNKGALLCYNRNMKNRKSKTNNQLEELLKHHKSRGFKRRVVSWLETLHPMARQFFIDTINEFKEKYEK